MDIRIRELRELAGLSQQALAEAVGVDQRHLARLESELSLAKIDVALRLAERLKADLVEVFPGLRESLEAARSSRAELVELHYDSSILQTFANAGVDLDPAAWTLKVRLRGGHTLAFTTCKSEAKRLRRNLTDRTSSAPFFVFYSSEVAVVINLDHLVHYHELWDSHTPVDWHDKQVPTEGVTVWLIDSPEPIALDVEVDEGTPDDEDDEGQLRHVLFTLQTYVEVGEFIGLSDVDGETAVRWMAPTFEAWAESRRMAEGVN